MKGDSSVQQTRRQRLLILKDRVLWWLNHYLAFDVQPRQWPPVIPTRRDSEPEPPSPPDTPRASPPAPIPAAQWRTALPPAPRALPEFSPGQRIADTYEVKERLCAGDFHTVYLAHHRHWNIDLIVKVPNPEFAAMPGVLRQFTARAEHWLAIGVHPAIAACYFAQSVEGMPVTIVEYVDGGDLRAWIDEGRCREQDATLREGLDLAIQICQGLDHAHSRAIVHGRLTPRNILLTQQGAPKLADFGSLMARSDKVARGGGEDFRSPLAMWALIRASDYVAPERWLNPAELDVRTDVFSLGVCLYEMFCGCLPYTTTAGARQAPPQPAALPEVLGTLLQRCVAWERGNRPGSAVEVQQALSAAYEALFGQRGQMLDTAREADELNNQAVSYWYLGNHTAADAAWEAALAADPAHIEAAFNQSVSLWRRGTLTDEGLAQHIETLQAAREDRWKVHYLLALIHLERGDAAAALASLEQTIRERPGTTEAEALLQKVRSGTATVSESPRILGGHRQYVAAVCVTSDGTLALSGSYDTTAALWDVRTGQQVRLFEGHDAPVSCVFLSNDGRWAVTGSDDRSMRIWNIQSGACHRVFDGGAGRISSVALSADGKLLLWAAVQSSADVEQMTLQLWDANAGRCLRMLEGHASAVKSACLSADARHALSGSDDQTVRLWDLTTGKCLRVFEGHRHFVSAVCFSSDGEWALSGSWDQTLRLWEVQSGRCLRTFNGHTALVTSVCLSSDKRWALSGGWDRAVRFWEVNTGRCVRTFRDHTSLVTGVALSTQANVGLSSSWDRTIRLWPLPTQPVDFCKPRRAGTPAPAKLSLRP